MGEGTNGHLPILLRLTRVNAGWSVGGDAYDYGAIIVLAGVMPRHGAPESGVQGEGWQVSKRPKKKCARCVKASLKDFCLLESGVR